MKILVVEDDNDQCILYKIELEEEGYEVIYATTAEEGMKMFRRENPDLVTLDIHMSESDREGGIRLFRQIKNINPKMSIILLTAYDDYKNDFVGSYADAYIVKSSDLSELKSTIKRLLPAASAG